MSLRKETVSGIKWQVGVSLISRIISFGTTIIIARILGPSNYGIFALGLSIVGAFGLFKSLGIEAALIQRKDNVQKAANTAFFIIPLLGLSLYLLLILSASMIGNFLKNNEVANVIRLLGLIFVFWSLSRVPLSLLEKKMGFSKISITELVGVIFFSASTIILAIEGYGVWSLVIGYIIQTLISSIMIFLFARWRPRFEFDKKIARELFNYGKFIFLGSVICFLKMNLDKVLVGRLLGVTMLGLYAVAFNIANFSGDYFGSKVYRVIFPAYSKIQGNLPNLKLAFLAVLKNITIIALPFGIGVFILGGEFLKFAYGSTWIAAIPILKILALAGIFNTIPIGNAAIFLALGRPKLSFWFYLIQVAIFFAFIAPFSRIFGLIGVGIVIVLASFISMIFSFYWSIKLLSLKFKDIYLCLRPGLLGSLIMTAGMIILKNIFPLFLNEVNKFNFILLFSSAVIMFLYSLFKIDKNQFIEMKKLFFS